MLQSIKKITIWDHSDNIKLNRISHWYNTCVVFFFGAFILTPTNTLGITSSLLVFSTLIYIFCSPKITLESFKTETAWISVSVITYVAYNAFISNVIRADMSSGQQSHTIAMLFWVVMLTYIRKTGFNSSIFFCGVGLGIVIGFYSSIISILENSARVSRDMSAFNPIFWGLFSALQSVIFTCVSYQFIKKRKYLYGALSVCLVLFSFINIIASGSRGSFIALAFSALITPFFITKNKKKSIITIIVIMVAISSLIKLYTVVLPESGLSQRIQAAQIESRDFFNGNIEATSVGLRWQMWGVGFDAVSNNPIIGNSRAEIQSIKDRHINEGKSSKQINTYPHLHNDYINTAAKLGLIGLFLLIAIYSSVIFTSLRFSVFNTFIVISAVGVLAGAGLTDSILASGRGTMSLLLVLLITLGLQASKSNTTENNKP